MSGLTTAERDEMQATDSNAVAPTEAPISATVAAPLVPPVYDVFDTMIQQPVNETEQPTSAPTGPPKGPVGPIGLYPYRPGKSGRSVEFTIGESEDADNDEDHDLAIRLQIQKQHSRNLYAIVQDLIGQNLQTGRQVQKVVAENAR